MVAPGVVLDADVVLCSGVELVPNETEQDLKKIRQRCVPFSVSVIPLLALVLVLNGPKTRTESGTEQIEILLPYLSCRRSLTS